jgi:hypothetical protein
LEYLGKEQVEINSPELIAEMGSFVKTRKPSGGIHWAAFDGYHDDRLMALAIALYIAHEQDVVNFADERRRMEERKRKLGEAELKPRQIRDLAATMIPGETVASLYDRALDSAEQLS